MRKCPRSHNHPSFPDPLIAPRLVEIRVLRLLSGRFVKELGGTEVLLLLFLIEINDLVLIKRQVDERWPLELA